MKLATIKSIVAAALVAAGFAAAAESIEVDYIAKEIGTDGRLVSVKRTVSAIPVTEKTTQFSNGWYVVAEKGLDIGMIDVLPGCTANLILMDGAHLAVRGLNGFAAMDVSSGEALNIYGQEQGSGMLVARGEADGAGVGGGVGADGGTVTIYGGVVDSSSQYGAGIGGGCGGTGGIVTINGGEIVAQSGGAACIGGGYASEGSRGVCASGALAITADAPIWVKTGENEYGADASVEVLKQKHGKYHYAHIMVADETKAQLRVPAGRGVACAVADGQRRMSPAWEDGDTDVYVVPRGSSLTVTFTPLSGYVFEDGRPTTVGCKMDADLTVSEVPEARLLEPVQPIGYLDWDEAQGELVERVCETYLVLTKQVELAAEEWYVVTNANLQLGTLVVKGTEGRPTHLVLAEGSSLRTQGGNYKPGIEVEVSRALIIHGPTNGVGKLSATGGGLASGIGGQAGYSCGSVTINGGTVTAAGNKNNAGIGGGDKGGVITINGGTVTAKGCDFGAGIGGGRFGDGGIVTINGGTVTATGGGNGAAGIGGGAGGAGCTLTVSGGVTEAPNGIFTEGSPTIGANMEVSGEFNKAAYIKIAEKETPTPTHKDNEDTPVLPPYPPGTRIIEPAEGETEVTLADWTDGALVIVPPTVKQVNGVGDDDYIQVWTKERSRNITGAFKIEGGKIALDPDGAVQFGDEVIPVRPTISILGDDATKPFVVGEGGVALTVRAIPGLVYELRRTGTLRREGDLLPFQWWGAVKSEAATGVTVTLTDDAPPAGKAFYRIEVSAAASAERPRIGIAWRADLDSEFLTNVQRAIKEAGGEPVLLGQVCSTDFDYDSDWASADIVSANDYIMQDAADKVRGEGYLRSNAAEVLGDIRAVVFTGGEDISPTLYKDPAQWHGIAEEQDYNAARDINDYELMAYCLARGDVAVLGICRGAQMLGIISGATVVQDIPTYFKGLGKDYDNTHRNVKETPDSYRDYASHSVEVVTGSILSEIVGGTKLEGCPSWHHQMIGSVVGTPLLVTGTTPVAGVDTIEAVEMRTERAFAVGVQFHPEAAVVKHLTGAGNAQEFMSLEQGLKFFRLLVDAVRQSP